jgi:predicted nucleic acid-binding protein
LVLTLNKKLKITLDTNCINIKPNPKLDKIFKLKDKGKIKIYIPDGVIKDILNGFKLGEIDNMPNTPSGLNTKQRLKRIGSCEKLNGPSLCGDDVYGRIGGTCSGKQINDLEKKIEKIINSKYDFEDIRILLLHYSYKNDIFITDNRKHFINNGRRGNFLKELGVEIMTPEEFINKYNV